MVGAVGEMLGLESDAVGLAVDAASAGVGAFQEVAGVDLDAGLGGEHGQGAAAGWVEKTGGEGWAAAGVDDPVVVVALSLGELDVVISDVGADRCWVAEVERSAGDGSVAAERDRVGVRGRVLVGVDRQNLIVDAVVRADAGEVEVGVVGQAQHSIPVRSCHIADREAAVVGE